MSRENLPAHRHGERLYDSDGNPVQLVTNHLPLHSGVLPHPDTLKAYDEETKKLIVRESIRSSQEIMKNNVDSDLRDSEKEKQFAKLFYFVLVVGMGAALGAVALGSELLAVTIMLVVGGISAVKYGKIYLGTDRRKF